MCRVDWRPCGDFPWDNGDVTVDCDYSYVEVKQWHSWSGTPPDDPVLVLRGRCTVTCPVGADVLVGPPYSDYSGWDLDDGAYYCNAGNSTWMGTEPVCLDRYDLFTTRTNETNGIRLLGGTFYGCVELFDDITQQWGPIMEWNPSMSWADLACRNLGFEAALATRAFFYYHHIVTLQQHYRPRYYTPNIPRFVLFPSLPQWKDWRPCGDFPWNKDDVTIDCDYTYSSIRQKHSWWTSTEPPLVLQGRCNVSCPDGADMLVGPPYFGEFGVFDGAYYCNLNNNTWMGAEPVCLGRYDLFTTKTNETNGIRLVGGEFYGCVLLYDDVTQQWGPVGGWPPGLQDKMAWADLACRNLGFSAGLATKAYTNEGMSILQTHYQPKYYPSTVPKFIANHSLPQWEGATLHDAIDRVERESCRYDSGNCANENYRFPMCLACAGHQKQDDPIDWRPCGDFPWHKDDITVDCDYTYSGKGPPWISPTDTPLVLHGRCTVTCRDVWAESLVGPPYSGDLGLLDGTYYCNVGNSTWMGTEPICLDRFSIYTVITNETNGIRLMGGEFFGCVELYDDVTQQWGPVVGFEIYDGGNHSEHKMSWANLACRNLGFNTGLATHAYDPRTWVSTEAYSLPGHFGHFTTYPSSTPLFVLTSSLPEWEGATLYDAIDRVEREPCPYDDSFCHKVYNEMCLACTVEDQDDANGPYNSSTILMDQSKTVRLVGGEFYGCVELYDNVTQLWGPVAGWEADGAQHENRMSWADLACRSLGFEAGLATVAYSLANGIADPRYAGYPLFYKYRDKQPTYPSTAPQFVLSQSLPQWEGATLHDTIDHIVRPCSYYGTCSSSSMCLACAREQDQNPQVSDINIHVTCTSDYMEASFPRPRGSSVQADDVQLAAPHCKAEENSTHIYIRAPLGECGTSREITPTEIIYRNLLTIGVDPSNSEIIWQQVTKMLHVQIQVDSSDTSLQVFPLTCVATPSDKPDDKIQNDVIVDGCATLPTLQFYPSPGPDRWRFGFQTFAFASGVGMVYLHCDVLLCNATDPNSRCAQGCLTSGGRTRREAGSEPDIYRLTQGPIVFSYDQTELRASRTTTDHQYVVTASAILGACAVLTGAMFVVGIVYKARREGRPAGYKE
uniref:ZP domain-containing protein n=1 Tax=Branchiostoma floridae TaxID=7739 RepID=C3YK69_BRAFL|eukprot:XP_002603515.1 hypothetical protein BRAFLDRAFT_79051 [Branchiostoma floridae]